MSFSGLGQGTAIFPEGAGVDACARLAERWASLTEPTEPSAKRQRKSRATFVKRRWRPCSSCAIKAAGFSYLGIKLRPEAAKLKEEVERFFGTPILEA